VANTPDQNLHDTRTVAAIDLRDVDARPEVRPRHRRVARRLGSPKGNLHAQIDSRGPAMWTVDRTCRRDDGRKTAQPRSG
jgi:hypothetical protein